MLKLIMEFLSIGLFTYGGGLAMLPLLQQRAQELGWMNTQEFTDMIAISQSTPGPIAINMATFIGMRQGGVLTAILVSIAVCLPGGVIALIVGKFMKQFEKNPKVVAMLKGLRAVVIGLILVAVVNISQVTLMKPIAHFDFQIWKYFDVKAIFMFGILTFASAKWDKSPIIYITLAGVIGAFLL